MTDLERVFDAYGPQDHEDFLDSLRGLNFQDPDWMYMPVDGDPEPWQGDVLPRAEIHFTSRDGEAARYTGKAMVLSHGCDVVPDQDPAATLAPVWSVPEYLDNLDLDEEQRETRRAYLVRNRLTNLLFLPSPRGDGPNRVVNFSYGSPVSTTRIVSIYDDLDAGDLLRLSDRGWYLLTGKLAHHFVREEESDDFPRE